MYDGIVLLFGKEGVYKSGIHNVAFNEAVIAFGFNILQVGKVSGVGKLVEVVDGVVGILVYEEAHHV